MNFISREAVLAILAEFPGVPGTTAIRAQIERLPFFPASNPDWERRIADRNVMGQTEDQFWEAVDRQN